MQAAGVKNRGAPTGRFGLPLKTAVRAPKPNRTEPTHHYLLGVFGTYWNILVSEKSEAHVLNELQKENENNTHRRQRQLNGKIEQHPRSQWLDYRNTKGPLNFQVPTTQRSESTRGIQALLEKLPYHSCLQSGTSRVSSFQIDKEKEKKEPKGPSEMPSSNLKACWQRLTKRVEERTTRKERKKKKKKK